MESEICSYFQGLLCRRRSQKPGHSIKYSVFWSHDVIAIYFGRGSLLNNPKWSLILERLRGCALIDEVTVDGNKQLIVSTLL